MVELRTKSTGYWQATAWLGLAFVCLVMAVSLGWLRPFDVGLGAAAKAGAACWARNASEAASVLLAGEISLIYAAMLALLCAWRGRLLAGLAVVAALLGTVAVELLFKLVFHQPSPGDLLATVSARDCLAVGYPLTSVSTTVVPNTLPSGYTTRAAFFGVLLVQIVAVRWPWFGKLAWLALGPVLLVLAASRVAIVWHWTSDVVAGLLLGAAAAAVVLGVANGFEWLGQSDRSPQRQAPPPGNRAQDSALP